ncbi:MAG: guanylate kinase [Deltaproteobacteria bacterium]|nr:guanylate kinase [Deltaproteobacteria bacterium]
MSHKQTKGVPFIVSAPSGAGKTTLCKMAVAFFPGLRHSISYTTRPPRAGEVDGEDYRFIDDAGFDRMVESGEFLEYAGVHGKRYGTSRKDLSGLLDEGTDVILDIDVQGAEKVRGRLSGGVYIFILPPSVEACEERLRSRGKDSPEEIKKRLRIALDEIKKAQEYQYIIINDNLTAAFEKLKSIMIAEKAASRRMMPRVAELFGAE